MNRRQFIQRVTSVATGLLVFGRPTLRGETQEMRVIMNRRPFVLDNFGICGMSIVDGIAAGLSSAQSEINEIRRIAHSLDDGKPVAARLDEFGRACAAQCPELAELPFPHCGSTRQEMERILAANPGMSREDAFFQVVMEIAEGTL